VVASHLRALGVVGRGPLLVDLGADSLDEVPIIALRICHGYIERLTPCLIGKCRRVNVGHPYLDRSKSLHAQALAVV